MRFSNLSQMLESEEFQAYQSNTILNIQYHIVNNTGVDVDQMIINNSVGNFGLSHQDFIENWRDFLNSLNVFDPEVDELGDYLGGKYDLHQSVYNTIMTEIENCENWHIKNGSINQII